MMDGNMIDEKVIDKILKLLALSKSPNQHEAESALAKAYELMEKYHLEMADIKERPEFVRHTDRAGAVEPLEWRFIFPILQTFFHVRIVSHGATRSNGFCFSICGTPQDVIFAEHIGIFLFETYPRLWKVKIRELTTPRMGLKRKRSIKQNYYFGVYLGLSSKLREAQKQFEAAEQQAGLIKISDALSEFMRTEFPGTEKNKIRFRTDDQNAIASGIRDGKQIEINKPIANSGHIPLQLSSPKDN